MLHIIFQRHHISLDDFFSRSRGDQAFMLESMKIQLKAEKKQRDGTADEKEGGE